MTPTGSVVQLGILCECTSFRQALGKTLRSEDWIERVVELDHERSVVVASPGSRIDVLVFVASITHRFGGEALKRLQSLTPRPKILLLSLDDDNNLALHALQAGALGI